MNKSEFDEKVCVICKKEIIDDKKYICTECYNKSLENLKHNELWQEIQKIDNPEWFLALVLVSAIFMGKGE